jgi:hypothetical protein
MGRYDLVTEWWVETSPEQTWNVLADYASWPKWWSGIRAVELLSSGDHRGVGAVLRQRWRSRLPYTLVFDLTMDGIDRLRRLDGLASGDLEGDCAWTFTEDAGGTLVRFSVAVRPTRWWMNLPLPFAGLVFRSNFDAIMGWGRAGLANSLGVRVEDRTAQARRGVG